MTRFRSFIAMTLGAVLTVLPAAAETSVTADTPPPAGTPLRLADAIQLAIQNNLTVHLAKAETEKARGQALQKSAELLPMVLGTMSQSRVFKENLEAQGFTTAIAPNFPLQLGPFNVFDARLQVAMKLLDISAIWKTKAGHMGEKIAKDEEELARDQVAVAAALSYLEAQRAQRAVIAVAADLSLSDSLLKLARDQHAAGVATGVDVARAETNRAQENLRLIRAQVNVKDADIRLKRVIGLPMSQPLTLEDLPKLDSGELPSVEKAIGLASQDRPEMRITREMVQQSHDLWRADQAANLPSITALGDYGLSGNLPNGSVATGSIGGRLQLPIFSFKNHGNSVESRAQAQADQDRYSDASLQIEEDIRLALEQLSAAMEETRTADQAAQLAQTELKMARDRYAAGVGDNIQILSAQTVLAGARDDQVNAVAHYDIARANLAAALGHIQELR